MEENVSQCAFEACGRLEGRFNEDIKAAKGFLQIRGFECVCAIMDKVNFAILV